VGQPRGYESNRRRKHRERPDRTRRPVLALGYSLLANLVRGDEIVGDSTNPLLKSRAELPILEKTEELP